MRFEWYFGLSYSIFCKLSLIIVIGDDPKKSSKFKLIGSILLLPLKISFLFSLTSPT